MAPRVLVDATAVPADRGALGRYVDGLVARALRRPGRTSPWPASATTRSGTAGSCPTPRVVAGPTAIAHRPARLAWEQTGLPLVAQQVDADVLHAPHYTMPLRPGVPVVVDHPRPDVLHRAGRAHPGQRHLLQVRDPHRGPPGHPAARPVQGHPGRAGPGARRRPDPDRRRLPRRGPLAVPPAQSRADAAGLRPARPARQAVRRLPRRPGAAQERARPDHAAGPRPCPTCPTRPRWCSPAAAAGATRSTRPSPRSPRTCAWSAPATCASATCPATSGGALVVAYPSRGILKDREF